jgi:murein DD-endopeptidase MepM/ murein hydrolase activator NlpD
VLLIVVLTLGALSFFLWTRNRQSSVTPLTTINDVASRATETPMPAITTATGPAISSPTVSPADIPEAEPGLSSSLPAGDATASNTFIGKLNLIIPVAGVRPEQLLDTFTDARSEGRSHDAIDILAPGGTPVLAATDGEIVKLFQSDRGGTTIYQLSPDKKLVFYYAHLQAYADGISAGKYVRQGEVVGYVGDSGNAGAGNYHLHFSIAVLADPRRYWEGTNINPYPLLRK